MHHGLAGRSVGLCYHYVRIFNSWEYAFRVSNARTNVGGYEVALIYGAAAQAAILTGEGCSQVQDFLLLDVSVHQP